MGQSIEPKQDNEQNQHGAIVRNNLVQWTETMIDNNNSNIYTHTARTHAQMFYDKRCVSVTK